MQFRSMMIEIDLSIDKREKRNIWGKEEILIQVNLYI